MMSANPSLKRPRGAGVVAAATLSTLIAIGILGGVTDLFQSRGEPMAALVAAERACAGNVYVSDRESCMHEWVVAARGDKGRTQVSSFLQRIRPHWLPARAMTKTRRSS